MKKLLAFFGFIVLLSVGVFAQDSSDEDLPWSDVPALENYYVRFRTVNATCYNNGKVEFAICDQNDEPIDQQTLESLHLSNFLVSHRGVILDTTMHRTPVEYTFPWTSVQLETGTFQITLECIYTDENHDLFAVETGAQLTVELDYVEPVIAPLTVTSRNGVSLGNIPSLDCDSTGRVQIRLEYGRFPYKVVVVNHEDAQDTLRVVVVDTNQQFGLDSTRWNYKDYYTFEQMPPGVWDYYLSDGCGYELPRATQQVDVVPPPILDHIGVYASSGDIYDSAVVKIRAYLEAEYPYYMDQFTPYMQYRFIVPASGDRPALQGENEEYNPWVDFPDITSSEVTLSAEIQRANTYCDLWDRDIVFQLRLKSENGICPGYVMSDTFHYHKPNDDEFIMENDWLVDGRSDEGYCAGSTLFIHSDNFSVRYSTNDPNHLNPFDDHDIKRYHFTYPIVWEYRDDANNLIKYDTILSDISERSYLRSSDFPNHTVPFEELVSMRLVDAHGCVLYENVWDIYFQQSTKGTETPVWRATKVDPVCDELRSIHLFEEYATDGANYDGLVIRLIDSPNDLYNFRAEYHANSDTPWTVNKDRIDNRATISTSSDGTSITISQNRMLSGTYTFEITGAPCVGTTYVSVWLKGLVTAELQQEPRHEIISECADKYIKVTEGQVVKVTTSRPEGDNSQVNRVETPLTTLFRVVDGPVGGYDAHDTRTYHIGDSVRISVPTGDDHPYVIKIYPDASISSICKDFAVYDTIYYNGSTVKFDFAMALLCDTNDVEGTAYIRAWNGNPPYLYQLYSLPDLGGEMLEEMTLDSGQVAIFMEKPMSVDTPLSCRVQDACGSAFLLNFYPQTLADLQKTWFDNGLTTITTCEGSTISIHSLRVGDAFQYKWYKNDETTPFSVSSDPTLFIPRNADTAVYHVEIYQTGCDSVIRDSATLYPKPSPSVKVEPVGPVCPGQEVVLTFLPHAEWGDEVEFTIVYENRQGIVTRNFNARSDEPVVDTFVTTSDTKVYPIYVKDDECDYSVADSGDTMFIYISDQTINPCQIITTHDTVCYRGDATLSAHCTEEAPLTIRWYSDFEMTDLLEEDLIGTTGGESYHNLYDLRERTYRYVSVEKPGWCPSVNNSPNNVVNMSANGESHVTCKDAFLFFDDGGADHDYTVGEEMEPLKYMFVNTENDQQLSIHFDSLILSSTSYLLVFSTGEPLFDGLLYEFTEYASVPDIIVSPTDTLMLYFIPGDMSASGWSAIVQPTPGIAIADIYKQNYTLYRDTVCQSQTKLYADPYNFANGDPHVTAQLNEAVKTSRVYLFERTTPDKNHCDSTVALSLWVTPPPYTQTDAVILSTQGPYVWNGLTCTSTGQYAIYSQPYADECDSAEILNLIVLQVDTLTGDVCEGEEVEMGIIVYAPDMNFFRPRPAVGDVLCTDGSILRPDSFLVSDKTAMGVVFYIDPNDPSHNRGKAVALFDASSSSCVWAPAPASIYGNVHAAAKYSSQRAALSDMDGYTNSQEIRRTALQVGGGSFKENAPAAYYCWFYDHVLRATGPVHKYWYLPSAGEMVMLQSNRVAVSHTLELLAGRGLAAPLIDEWGYETIYWTSTERDNSYAYSLNAKGQLMYHRRKDEVWNNTYAKRYVRAVRSFPN